MVGYLSVVVVIGVLATVVFCCVSLLLVMGVWLVVLIIECVVMVVMVDNG